MSRIMEMAKDLGGAIARTDEYQALRRVVDDTQGDEALEGMRSVLEGLEANIQTAMQAGEEPTDEVKQEYEQAVMKLQSNATYQRLVSAQTNFDKILMKVNQTIQEGIVSGAESRIIIP
jgi:cell fate (sporulation/competence/biofilm development) regulator YlbF (YheA/YmcA/DUF963 family)